jgi:regulatory protein
MRPHHGPAVRRTPADGGAAAGAHDPGPSEPARTEPARTQAAPVEPARPQAAPVEPARTEPGPDGTEDSRGQAGRAGSRGKRGRRGDRAGRRDAGRRAGAPGGSGPADGEEAPPADPEQAARAICLRLLTGQPRTRAELAAALQKRGIPDDAAEAVLDRFGEVGLIDDAAFAEAWVSSRHRGRGLASRALRLELHRRGVAAETVQDALGTLDDETQENTARSLVRRRLAATRTLAPEVRMRRLLGMLARKGYPAGLAARVIREEIGAELSGPDGESIAEALETLADQAE